MAKDWEILMSSSEVFKNYVDLMAKKKAESTEEYQLHALATELSSVERSIKSNPRLLKAFKELQNKFSNDLEFRKQADQNFADTVMLLNLNS